MAESAKAVSIRFNEEVINNGNLSATDDILSPEFVDHSAPPGLPPNREGVKMLFGMLHEGLSGLRVEIGHQVEQGSMVATLKTITGVHTGSLFGAPPTGKTVSFDVFDLLRVDGDRIQEHWDVIDQMGLMTQIGALGRAGEAASG